MALGIRIKEDKDGKGGSERGAYVLLDEQIVATITLSDEMKTIGVAATQFKEVRIVGVATGEIVVVQLDVEEAPDLPPGKVALKAPEEG